ncbi:elongation factor P [Altererythrobacter litoralis]|jgi:hypothetical protein|uniref:Elongation factor P n=1 Tax=Altererythrobacter litoralis TaxID=3113904 RepID=A0ABU7GG13_9SPHN|nr:elongation factor P [Erythrobacteraceae bacterium 1XM1-14]
MKRLIPLTFLPALALAAPAQGEILKTMPHGPYQCSLPGDAAGPALIPVDEESFTITRASRYRTETGRGTYLLRGDLLTFTGGPKNGQQLRRTGTNELRSINEDGSTGRMICVRVGSNY